MLDRYLDDLGESVDGDMLLTRCLEYTSVQGMELYPALLRPCTFWSHGGAFATALISLMVC